MDRLTRSQGSLFRKQSSLYRTHAQLMLDSENRKAERKRSEIATNALRAFEKRRKALWWPTLRERAISALEWLLVALAIIGATYGGLVLLSEYVCTFRGVC